MKSRGHSPSSRAGVLGRRDRAAVAALVAQEAAQTLAGVEALGLGVGVGADGADGGDRLRGIEVGRRREAGAVALDRGARRGRIDEVGGGVGQAELSGGIGAPAAGAEEPEREAATRRRRDVDAAEGVLGREVIAEEGEELGELLGKVVVHRLARAQALEGVGVELAAAGRPADAEVDAAGVERLEDAEGLDDFEGAVVGQEDGAGADANRRGLGGDAGDHDLRRRAGEGSSGVVLGEPVAAIAARLR